METPVVVHLMTQRNQPYGSSRRCCERCGVMIWHGPPEGEKFADDESVYEKLPEGHIACKERTK